MHECRFEEVELHLVEVGDGAEIVARDVSLVVELLHGTADARPAVCAQLGSLVLVVIGLVGSSAVEVVGVAVDPLLYLDDACAVVHFVSYVRGLHADVADLGDEGDLRHVLVVEDEGVGVGVRVHGAEELADCDGAEAVVCVFLAIESAYALVKGSLG